MIEPGLFKILLISNQQCFGKTRLLIPWYILFKDFYYAVSCAKQKFPERIYIPGDDIS